MTQWAGHPPTSLYLISMGPQGVRDTLQRMAQIVREYRRNPVIRQLAIEVRQAAKIPARDYRGEAAVLHRFVKDYITYVRDVRDVDTLTAPVRVLVNRAGDCDCQAMLLSSLLEAIGHKTAFVAMGFHGGPDYFEHVLTETKLGQRWVPLETTVERPFGWNPPAQVARMVETV